MDDNPDPLAELRRIYGLWERSLLPWSRPKTAEDLAQAGKAEAARVERERALAPPARFVRANPNDAEFLGGFASVLVGFNLDLDRAVELGERAVKLAPEEDFHRLTLAEAYFRRGNVGKAVEIEAELVRKNPGEKYCVETLERFKTAQKP